MRSRIDQVTSPQAPASRGRQQTVANGKARDDLEGTERHP